MPKPIRDPKERDKYSRALTEKFRQDLSDLTQQLQNGQIDLGYWQITMREDLRKQYALQLIKASGGKASEVDPDDWLRLGNQLKEQYEYLENFAHQIADGTAQEGMLTNRAAMYADSSREAYWRQYTKGYDLPAYPGDGSSCYGLTRCGCSWIDNGDGTFTWELGETEHCDQCLQHSEEWNPYDANSDT
jgi:hypothetical protein